MPFTPAQYSTPFNINPKSSAGAGGGGGGIDSLFEILGRHELDANADSMSVTFTAHDNLLVLVYDINNGSSDYVNPQMRLGNASSVDDDEDYSYRYQDNGTGEATQSLKDEIDLRMGELPSPAFSCTVMNNIADEEKLLITQTNIRNSTGAGSAPAKNEIVGKWKNTSIPASRIDIVKSASGNFAIGSELVVLGYNNDKSSGNSFTELANEELDGTTSDTLDSGVFTSKKYLYCQISCIEDGLINTNITFNSTNSGYARRRNNDFTGDSAATSESSIDVLGDEEMNKFIELWILNTDSDEKLVIGNMVRNGSSGAGNPPLSNVFTAKWASNSQVERIKCDNTGTGEYDSGSSIKVWGFD